MLKMLFSANAHLMKLSIDMPYVSKGYCSLIDSCMKDIVCTVCVQCNNKVNGCFNPSLVHFVCLTFTHACCYVVFDLVPMVNSMKGSEFVSGWCLGLALVCITALTLYGSSASIAGDDKCKAQRNYAALSADLPDPQLHGILSRTFTRRHTRLCIWVYMYQITLFVFAASDTPTTGILHG